MDQPILRRLIQEKLGDGRLSHNPMKLLWNGGPGNGETCQACDDIVTKEQLVMEGVDSFGRTTVQMHVACFYLWETERQMPINAPNARRPARSAFNAPGARRQWSPLAPPPRPASPA